jgi:hypothetical protein
MKGSVVLKDGVLKMRARTGDLDLDVEVRQIDRAGLSRVQLVILQLAEQIGALAAEAPPSPRKTKVKRLTTKNHLSAI